MSNRIRSLLAALSALLLSGTCMAQGNGVIYGTVTDPSGAGVAGAKVEAFLIGRGTTRTGTTSASGEYVFPAMPIGAWEIRVTAAGFQQFRRPAVTLDANQNVRERPVDGKPPSVSWPSSTPANCERFAG